MAGPAKFLATLNGVQRYRSNMGQLTKKNRDSFFRNSQQSSPEDIFLNDTLGEQIELGRNQCGLTALLRRQVFKPTGIGRYIGGWERPA